MRWKSVVISSFVGLLLTACASDGDTSTTEPASFAASTSPVLISELPEISGPTVLWFWAPG